jgi:2-methylaconitate cis-trans-isomerase PrpF
MVGQTEGNFDLNGMSKTLGRSHVKLSFLKASDTLAGSTFRLEQAIDELDHLR